MPATLRTSCAIAALCLLGACASAVVADAPLKDAQLQLLPGQSADLNPNVSLRYDQASDSRCPPKVQCVWAGKLGHHFTLRARRATESFELADDQPEFVSTMLGGVRIVLAKPPSPSPRTVDQPVQLSVLTHPPEHN
ncbi:MAG: hypothetical protein V4508_00060 [Pseudomonadota bacterium]